MAPADDDPTREHNRAMAVALHAETVQQSLTPVVGQTFENATIYLDGRAFTDCTFRNCRLVIRLGLFEAHNTVMNNIEVELSTVLLEVVAIDRMINAANEIESAAGRPVDDQIIH